MRKIALLFGPLVSVGLLMTALLNNSYLLTSLFMILLIAFQVIYIVDCVRNQRTNAPLWILGLVFLFTIVHLFYWFTFLSKPRRIA